MTEQLPQIEVNPDDNLEVEIVFADNQLVIINNGAEVHSTKSAPSSSLPRPTSPRLAFPASLD